MEYYCSICEKKYKSYKSLWKHNYIYHKENVVINNSETNKNKENVVIEISEKEKNNEDNNNIGKVDYNRTCKHCKKILCDRKYRWKHEQKCKNNNENNKIELVLKENLEIKNTNSKIEKENLEIKKEMLEYKKEMEKLKEMLQKSLKIHPKTLNKINSQLNNNGVINNINIVQLGRENLSDILSSKEKRGILNRQVMGINDLVELVHISGKYKKFMNVYITNLQNTIAYKFDEKMNNFIAVNKSELLNDLVDARMYDIEKFFEEIGPTLDSKKSDQIKKFIERMNNEEDELKGIKKDEIKLVLYNNLEKLKMNEPNIIKIDDKEINV